MNFAIIGAGIAGLACAHALVSAGHKVRLFDKGRGPGGRMSTRRLDTLQGVAAFDHGAQYFTVRDPLFQAEVADWANLGVAAPWPAVAPDAWVGIPAMNAVIKHLAAAHDVSFGSLINMVRREGDQWVLGGPAGRYGPFDGLVIAIPAEQAAALLGMVDLGMARIALSARSQPCWTAMFAFDQRLPIERSVITHEGIIAWATRNSEKPGRSGLEAWVVQAVPGWSSANIEQPAEWVAQQMWQALSVLGGGPMPQPLSAIAHRWRFALSAGTGDGAIWDEEAQLGVCGDWLIGPRVECAWLSGRTLARKMTGAEELLAAE